MSEPRTARHRAGPGHGGGAQALVVAASGNVVHGDPSSRPSLPVASPASPAAPAARQRTPVAVGVGPTTSNPQTGKPPFAALVEAHGPTVRRVCRAMVGWDDADDVWAETFLAALRAYPALPPGANHEAWLVTIARRKAIDSYRARQRRPLTMERLPEHRHHGAAADPTATLPDDEALAAALRQLTARQRDAVVLHYVAGLPYAAVAAALGGSEASLRRAAADGIKRLRALLPATDSAGA